MKARTAAVWTVVNTGTCPHCTRPADLTCQQDRHYCADCGTDRGSCDKAATHHQQPTLF